MTPVKPAAEQVADDDSGSEILVTGSRLRDPSFAAPLPLQILTIGGVCPSSNVPRHLRIIA